MGARLSEFGVPLWPPLLLTCPRCLLAHPCEIIKSLKGTSVTKESYLIAPSDVSSSILRHGHHHPDCQSALTLLTEIPPSNSCLSRFAKIYTSTHPDPCLPSPAAFFLLNRPLAAAAAPDSFSQAKPLTLLHACAALFSVCKKHDFSSLCQPPYLLQRYLFLTQPQLPRWMRVLFMLWCHQQIFC
jgi:hypothetical protein